MNKLTLIILLVISCLIVSCVKKKQGTVASQPKHEKVIVALDTMPRTSITFILGKDDNSRNPYYSLANIYYRINKTDKTEVVIDTISSLLDVRNYLIKNPPKNGRPWGLINLVSHGNEFIDLTVKVAPNGARTSSQSLFEAIRDTVFRPLDSTIVDAKSFIYLHGCAVGNNTELLRMLGIAFGGTKRPVPVKATKLFEYYGYVSNNRNPQAIRRYVAKVWYAFHNADSFPPEAKLIQQLRIRYPKEKINWAEAIRRQFPSSPAEIYHIRLIVPVIWDDFYKRSELRPVLNTSAKQAQWLAGKPEFLALIKKTKIPYNFFNIKYFNAEFKTENGNYYAVRAKARAGVVCLIKPLLATIDSLRKRLEPFYPQPDDTICFGFSSHK